MSSVPAGLSLPEQITSTDWSDYGKERRGFRSKAGWAGDCPFATELEWQCSVHPGGLACQGPGGPQGQRDRAGTGFVPPCQSIALSERVLSR